MDRRVLLSNDNERLARRIPVGSHSPAESPDRQLHIHLEFNPAQRGPVRLSRESTCDMGGAQTSLPNTAFTSATNFPGLVTNNQTMGNSLLYFLAGSVQSATQIYFIQSPNHNNQWLSYADKKRKINEPHQNEFSVFLKD